MSSPVSAPAQPRGESREHVLDILRARGFVYDITDEEGLRRLMAQPVTFYAGFDPTADSLHVGHLVQIMVMANLQRAGHRPIVIVGGGTGLVGDPSGKQTARPVLTREEVDRNLRGIRAQLERFLDFREGRALLVNNADWLAELGLLAFLRDIGFRVSVAEMLAAESIKTRLATGLTYAEFSYRLLQAYDFLELYRRYGCRLQVGGSDQWGNITAGIDLIRRIEGAEAFGLVSPLLATASGRKMGKTEQGTVWLSAERTSPYDFYQYWINTEDPDVQRFLALFTFLPMEEVERLGALRDAEIRQAKEVLAYEVTRLVHGEAAAQAARAAARALFAGEGTLDSAPTTTLPAAAFAAGLSAVDLFVQAGLVGSKSEASRLIRQGGAYVNDVRLEDEHHRFTTADLRDGALLLRAGKKRYRRVVAEVE